MWLHRGSDLGLLFVASAILSMVWSPGGSKPGNASFVADLGHRRPWDQPSSSMLKTRKPGSTMGIGQEHRS